MNFFPSHTFSSFGSLCANLNIVLLVWLLTAKCKKDNIFLFRCLVFFCYFNQFFPEWPSWRHKDKDHRTGRISKFLLHWVSRLQFIWLLSDQEFGSRYKGGIERVCNLDLFFYLTCLPPPPRPGRDGTSNENGGNISLERAMCLDQFKILVSLGTGPHHCDSPGKALLALLLEVSGGKENARHYFKNKLLALTEAKRKEVIAT